MHLHDDQASRQNHGYRRIWNRVLRLFTLLQFLPGAWWTTRTGVERGIYPEFPPPAESPAPPRPALVLPAGDWREAIQLAAPGVQGLLEELSEHGAPVPEVGFELVGTEGAILAQAELAWPEHEVAVLVADDEEQCAAFERAGWQVFMSGAGGLADGLANAFTGAKS